MWKWRGYCSKGLAIGLICLTLPVCAGAQANWFEIGLGYLQNKRYGDAAQAFTQVIETVPHDIEALNNRGVTRMFQGNLTGALEDFNRALKVDAGYEDALYNRALIRTRQSRYELAVVDLDQLLLVNPESARGYNQRGFVRTKQGDLEGAIADYEQALALFPRWVEVYNNIAWLLATCPDPRIRNGQKAVTLAQKAVELNPSADYYATLAAAHAENGAFEQAIAVQQQVREILGTNETEAQKAASRTRIAKFRTGQPLREDYAPAAATEAQVPSAQSPAPKKVPPKAAAKQETVTSDPAGLLSAKPFAIQVATYEDPQVAFNVARELIGKGYVAYTAPVLSDGQPRWTRVLVGRYADVQAAQPMLTRLTEKQFMQAYVVSMPYCLGLNSQLTAKDQLVLGKKMAARGIQTFRLDSKQEKLLMAGAFTDPELAETVAAQLAAEGIACRVAQP